MKAISIDGVITRNEIHETFFTSNGYDINVNHGEFLHMSTTGSRKETAARLLDVIRIIDWMDSLRWKHEEERYLATIAPFMKLNDDEKILAHWICYITDRMRPVVQVWKSGGTIFSQLVYDYSRSKIQTNTDFMALLKQNGGYVEKSRSGKIDVFVSKKKRDGEDCNGGIEYAPRYGDDFLSVLRTLMILLEYKKSIVSYLKSMRPLWFGKDDEMGRVAFLLYILSYENLNGGLTELSPAGQRALINNGETQLGRIKRINEEFEKDYAEWSRSKRYHKRLWAALRDYLKNPLLSEHFLHKLKIAPRKEELLGQLELPGDVWNERFSDRLLKPLLTDLYLNGQPVYVNKSPITTRRLFEWLQQERGGMEKYYPEQFDVSYSFASRMCENEFWRVCPFGENGSLSICLREQNSESMLCPVILTTCGYFAECNPAGCPIVEGVGKGLCQSCKGIT